MDTYIDLQIPKEYHDTPVKKYETIYLILHGIEKNREIKLGSTNKYYKGTMKKLLGKKGSDIDNDKLTYLMLYGKEQSENSRRVRYGQSKQKHAAARPGPGHHPPCR